MKKRRTSKNGGKEIVFKERDFDEKKSTSFVALVKASEYVPGDDESPQALTR